MPVFSVIIPLYNKEKNIADTLQSVFRQVYTDFEVIIINDGSTDAGEEEVLKFKDNRLVYKATVNRGISKARNTGIEMAKGNLIAFLDADDIWLPNHLETLYRLSTNYPQAGLLASGYEFVHPDGAVQKTFFTGIPEDFYGIVPDVFASSLTYRIMWTSAVAARADVFKAVGVFDESITLGAGEDTDMWIRIALNYPVALSTIVSAQYILGGVNRVSHTQTLNRSFATLDKFTSEEKSNKSLQRFMDLYRASYALKHKMAGDSKTFTFYYKSLNKANIPFKTKVLLATPAAILKMLFTLKQALKRKKIYIDIYN